MRNPDLVLAEIERALSLVLDRTAGLSKSELAADPMLQLGIERALEIVSEAVRHLPQAVLDRRADIRWRDIRNLGNVLRHEYWRVDPETVWNIVANELPRLLEAVLELRAGLTGPGMSDP
jgi:uncharacterized protein with HEPN domain